MTRQTTSEAPLTPNVSQLRCIKCGSVRDDAGQDFRCAECGNLFEVVYPGWTSGGSQLPDAPALQALWRQRRTSRLAVDESGVWRFRELLPSLRDWNQAITLREGNTPIYELHSCAGIAGIERLYAKHQGMNPTGSFKDTGMTLAASMARQKGFRWVACASTGNTSASMAAYAARGGARARGT